jgi:3'-phosphoadenosine 5'-phosphosulfate sulfotransferase (PAPS reductase)/FAD synthetase
MPSPPNTAHQYGANLWQTNDERYDYLAKVEPAQRAYSTLKVQAVLTGRRRSQGGKRGDLDIIRQGEPAGELVVQAGTSVRQGARRAVQRAVG